MLPLFNPPLAPSIVRSHIDGKSREEKLSAFRERAGRQLLVSLHEATHGMPFEDIVTDEYNSIVPEKAKSIYLTICILNRFNVSVRAGLISRLHGVHLTEFKKSFFRPLEHVVYTVADPISRDLAYTARHPLIADIVFHRVLTDQEERFEKFTSVLNALDIDYSSDRQAFRGMLRGKAIAELFPNLDMARSVFESAYQMAPHDAYVLHQDAIFHMIHSEFHEASDLLAEAARLRPNDTTILHSRSELLLKLAEYLRKLGARSSEQGAGGVETRLRSRSLSPRTDGGSERTLGGLCRFAGSSPYPRGSVPGVHRENHRGAVDPIF